MIVSRTTEPARARLNPLRVKVAVAPRANVARARSFLNPFFFGASRIPLKFIRAARDKEKQSGYRAVSQPRRRAVVSREKVSPECRTDRADEPERTRLYNNRILLHARALSILRAAVAGYAAN